jgi:hypothetical protein
MGSDTHPVEGNASWFYIFRLDEKYSGPEE